MRYAKIKHLDIANGPGIRESLFLSGCNLRCKGCFNYDIWDYNYGNMYTIKTSDEIVETFRNTPQLSGFSLLGGEPFGRSKEDYSQIIELLDRLKSLNGNLNFWVWSGHTFEELTKSNIDLELLKQFDVLVDGPFVEEEKNMKLLFRGSNNQRIIDIKESLKNNKVILHNLNKES